eukprot:364899-Chlamydomonas_euryale.AAC.30
MSARHEPPAKRQKAADDLVVDAEEAVSFHGLSSTSREALLAEIEAGGTEFQGEFFHQVRLSHRWGARSQRTQARLCRAAVHS